jgi:hypothetical protein
MLLKVSKRQHENTHEQTEYKLGARTYLRPNFNTLVLCTHDALDISIAVLQKRNDFVSFQHLVYSAKKHAV